MNRLLGGARPAHPNRDGAGSGRPSMMTSLLGGRSLRYNRMLDKLNGGDVLFKVPQDFGADEHNYVFGLGRQSIAAGAQVTFKQNADRDLILRDLTVDEQSLAFGAAGAQDATVLSITVEGNTLALGGGCSITQFSSRAVNKPKLDLPVAGGTPVTVTIQNNSAAAQVFNPTFSID